jgi:hypothetical protein
MWIALWWSSFYSKIGLTSSGYVLTNEDVTHRTRSISSVGLERGANNAKVLGSTPILTIEFDFFCHLTAHVSSQELDFLPGSSPAALPAFPNSRPISKDDKTT